MIKKNQISYPSVIQSEFEKALTYFPNLTHLNIEVSFKQNIKKSTMLAQPVFSSILGPRENRKYKILISKQFKIADQVFKTTDIPSDVMIGWLGHELGHIVDYQRKSNIGMIWFGIRYLISQNHVIHAERSADTFAVKHGMKDYILKTKNYILNHAKITDSYKLRMRKYYLSPEEIMEIIE